MVHFNIASGSYHKTREPVGVNVLIQARDSGSILSNIEILSWFRGFDGENDHFWPETPEVICSSDYY